MITFQKIETGKYLVELFGIEAGTVEKAESATRSYWDFTPNSTFKPAGASGSPQEWGGWKSWDSTRESAVYCVYGRMIESVEKEETTLDDWKRTQPTVVEHLEPPVKAGGFTYRGVNLAGSKVEMIFSGRYRYLAANGAWYKVQKISGWHSSKNGVNAYGDTLVECLQVIDWKVKQLMDQEQAQKAEESLVTLCNVKRVWRYLDQLVPIATYWHYTPLQLDDSGEVERVGVLTLSKCDAENLVKHCQGLWNYYFSLSKSAELQKHPQHQQAQHELNQIMASISDDLEAIEAQLATCMVCGQKGWQADHSTCGMYA